MNFSKTSVPLTVAQNFGINKGLLEVRLFATFVNRGPIREIFLIWSNLTVCCIHTIHGTVERRI